MRPWQKEGRDTKQQLQLLPQHLRARRHQTKFKEGKPDTRVASTDRNSTDGNICRSTDLSGGGGFFGDLRTDVRK